MQGYIELIKTVRDWVFNGPALVLLLITGIFLSYQLKFVQLRFLGQGFKRMLTGGQQASGKGDVNAFQAMMISMAGTIGTGNITGIATAVVVGGYGAIFWMWVVAFFGMATAYAETILGHHFRTFNHNGSVCGGPMYTLSQGLGYKKMGVFFSICAIMSSFGYAMVQSNSVVDALVALNPDWHRAWVGGLVVFATALVVIGGIKILGKVSSVLVPFMALLYCGMGILILMVHMHKIPSAFMMILTQAFTGTSVLGGVLGGGLLIAIHTGVQYGIFANEAGLGSYAISGASSRVKDPVDQGIQSMTSVFIATMLVCTMTGLVLAVTSDLVPTQLVGSPLAMAAFSTYHPFFRYLLLIGLVLFAFTTILAWQYYGERCMEYIMGSRCLIVYRIVFLVMVFLGGILQLDAVWATAHLANACMMIPNTISILRLVDVVKQKTLSYRLQGA
jgi:AGCS family alanine or glycine:cation symporter